MSRNYFLIQEIYQNGNFSYWGKNHKNLPLNSGKDNYELALIIQEIGYKTKQNAIKGIKTLKKYLKEIGINYKYYKFKIQAINLIKGE